MSIDRRITNGLAWAGVLLIVGVPTADLLSAQFMDAPATSVTAQVAVAERVAPVPAPVSQRPAAPVSKPDVQIAAASVAKPETHVPAKPPAEPARQVAAVAPAKPAASAKPAAQTGDPVKSFLQSGRELPAYITEGGATAKPAQATATAPVASTQTAAATPARTPITAAPAVKPEIDPVEVASIGPQKVAPMPMPLSMRPEPVAVALVREPTPVIIPPTLTPAAPAAVIRPPAVVRPPAEITAADLEDWETGPLADFLAKRQAANAYVDPEVDPDGFFLDQGPNRPRRDRIVVRPADPFFFFAD